MTMSNLECSEMLLLMPCAALALLMPLFVSDSMQLLHGPIILVRYAEGFRVLTNPVTDPTKSAMLCLSRCVKLQGVLIAWNDVCRRVSNTGIASEQQCFD